MKIRKTRDYLPAVSLGLTEKMVQTFALNRTESIGNQSLALETLTSFGRKWFSTIGTVYLLTMTIRVIVITIMIIIMKILKYRGVELSWVGSKNGDAVTTARVKSSINFAPVGSLLSGNITELCAHA